ncbi:MAG TPA: CsbD family protein [Planctomycetota bacterium]|nr:CsbD family protein [Planctomycetota bacterium]
MNIDILKGQWKQLKGDVKQWWGKLTDDDLEYIDGSKDKLIGKLQERYGYTREKAEEEADKHLMAHNP